MFNRGKLTGSSRVPADSILSILGEGTHWQGEIHAGANGLRVEGVVEGTILSEGQVVVAPTGLVKGTIHSKHLSVTGRVEGVFKVSGRLSTERAASAAASRPPNATSSTAIATKTPIMSRALSVGWS